MYRGDKDFRLGMELCKKPGVRYTALVPDVSSPGDSAFFGTVRFPRDEMPRFPDGMSARFLKSRLIYFSKRNISLGGFFQLSFGYSRALEETKPDLIFENPYTTLTPRSYQTWLVARGLGIPMVYVDPGDIPPKGPVKKFLSKLEGCVVRNASRIIVYNELGKERFVGEYGCHPDKIEIIPKPVDTSEFVPGTGREAAREQIGAGDRFVVAYFGRLSNNKGCVHLLEAARAMRDKGLERDYLFLFAGGNIIERDAMAVRELAERYKLDNVRFTGKLPHDDMVGYQAASDAVVYPDVTNLPGFSSVLSESMSMGKPIVIGVKGFEGATPIKDGENGVIVKARDSKAIIEAIVRLRADGAERERMGKAARDFAVRNMDWAKVADKHHDIFEKALSEK
jgi:glycosyltransferase involved in cell wall biosynthesis